MLELSIIFELEIVNNNMDESLIEASTDLLIERALEIAGKSYSKEEIIKLLKDGDEFEKPVVLMSLENIDNQAEADYLIDNLTGCDGRIREASALKISEFLQKTETSKYFLDKNSLKIILDGIMDINPNVSRALIEGIKGCKALQSFICKPLIERILNIIGKLKEIADTPYYENRLKNSKNHAKNKIVFNLYWALEALYYTEFNNSDDKKLLEILNFTSSYIDYTIREKAAKILSKMDKVPSDLLQKLKNDKNFYVKNQLLC